MPSFVEGMRTLAADKTLDEMFTETFTIQTRTRMSDSMGGFTDAWSDGKDFEGRLSVITDAERLRNDKITVLATHRIFSLTSVVTDEDDRIKLGTRYFNTAGIVKPSNMANRPGHYEILVTEID